VSSEPRFFKSAADFRRWLEKNHASVEELWIGFWKLASGRGGLTYLEAVDESLCFGWIDGLKKSHDEHAFKQRFTPRRPRSIWSAINIRKVEALKKAGRMAEPGLRAYSLRDPARSSVYSFENRDRVLDPGYEKRFRAKKKAWTFFEAQPPGYRRLATHYVMSAKKPETRERRLARLIEGCAAGRRLF
jgi:uncharacterized protein YdeI (YjbR/CyaY-like superfamily)